jgi:hypothetical protein
LGNSGHSKVAGHQRQIATTAAAYFFLTPPNDFMLCSMGGNLLIRCHLTLSESDLHSSKTKQN